MTALPTAIAELHRITNNGKRPFTPEDFFGDPNFGANCLPEIIAAVLDGRMVIAETVNGVWQANLRLISERDAHLSSLQTARKYLAIETSHAEAAEAERDRLAAQVEALSPPPEFEEGAAIGFAQATHEINQLRAANAALTARVAELEGALGSAASHLWFAASKMKGRCSGSDVSAVAVAEANARASHGKEPT